MQKAIAIDFDGTLCTNDYPNIGEPNWEIIAEAKMEQANGAGLILWTCREGEMLDAALKACEEWELHFDVVNESLPSWKKEYGNNPRKVGASEYWDDRSVRVRNGRFEHPENLSKYSGLDVADESEAVAVMEIGEDVLEKLAKTVGVEREPGESWRRLRRRTVEQMLTTQDWVTDWEVTTDFNGFPLKYPRVIDLCPQCRAMYGKRPLKVGGKIQHHV